MQKVNVILSAEKPARTPAQDNANIARTNALHLELHARDIHFVPARGFYKGAEERSVVALIDDLDDFVWLSDLAFGTLGQESVLVVDANLVAVLYFADGRIERLGVMTRVNEFEARRQDAWTRVRRPMDVSEPFDYYVTVRDLAPISETIEVGLDA
jgi:hypothetical protein